MTDTARFIPFIPKADRTAKQNRMEFIRFCREDLTTFGADLDFNAHVWDVSDYYIKRGRPGRIRIQFTLCSTGAGRSIGIPFPDPLGAFAKAYTRYCASRKRAVGAPGYPITAFRMLALALSEKGLGPDVGLIDAHVLNHAVHLIAARYSSATGAGIGSVLAEIANFLRTNHLSDCIPVAWKHAIIYVKSDRIGKEADARREAKLPTEETLDTMARAYSAAIEPRDAILTSVMALLCCAPDRINEVFALSEDCEVEEVVEGKAAYALRWAGSKIYPDHLKLIPSVMVDLAKDAIKRLRKHTEEARRIAAWYEANPGKLYLPSHCAHLRGRDLTFSDIMEITGMASSAATGRWVRQAGIECVRSGRRPAMCRFTDVECAIVALLPRGFPILDSRTGLRHSQAMMVVRRHEFAIGRKSVWRCMISPVTYYQVWHGFRRSAHGEASVFERLGLSTEDRRIGLTSHQIRHYLNTIANKSNLSPVDIAAWSGRSDIGQNGAYDHETGEEILERRRRMEKQAGEIRAARGVAALPTKATLNPPVSRDDIRQRRLHGHATALGFCEHDFASAPCPMFMECLHCRKHICIKGDDPNQIEKVTGALELARQSLSKALTALSMEYDGAEDWVQAHTQTVYRLEQLLAILTDPDIPGGSRVALAKGGRYTLIQQALFDHGEATSVHLLPALNRVVIPSAPKTSVAGASNA